MTEEELSHYGVLRRSGRYPWGSGNNAYQNNQNFLGYVKDLQDKGLSETEIAKGLGITTTELRAEKSIAKNEIKKQNQIDALRYKEKGMSNTAISEKMGIPESSVRAMLKPAAVEKANSLEVTSSYLKELVDEQGYTDVGTGVNQHLNISDTKLRTALAKLADEGYVTHTVPVEQVGTGLMTKVKVLCPPGSEWKDAAQAARNNEIRHVNAFSEDGGESFMFIQPPLSVSSARVGIKYAEDGGADADGVIYVRPGVEDISLGKARYAQVRIAVDGTHYLKGMAIYKDDLPDGVDLQFNTNKSNTGNKLDAMKAMKDDPQNPFGSTVRQILRPTKDGKTEVVSAMNIVNEEGVDWDNWSRNLSSQVLSKQKPALAKQQLDIAYDIKRAEYDEIMSLTNPAVRKRLLTAFADDADASAVHLKAAALPRQKTHVILPINSMKETEIYAPNYNNGERVALIRFPHGGKFEIPELTVNNKNPEAKKILGNAPDAVGIHSKVAQRLSGADFDGDTVLVIPNRNGLIKTSPPLQALKGFDPQIYKDPSLPKMKPRTKGHQMGLVSNLITDMTIKGASDSELARAVRHSMVVIDAEKHGLNYKKSAIDHGIPALMEKYQGKKTGGSSTLISKAKSQTRVPERKLRPASKGGPIDPETGKLVYEYTGRTKTTKSGKVELRTTRSTKLAETNDAFTLSSGLPMENVYAAHSNKLKSLANEARKSLYTTPSVVRNPSAAKVYSKEVDSLTAKLNAALKNKPLERQAQLIAQSTIRAKVQANPGMEADDLKKVKAQALAAARARTSPEGRLKVDITTREWEAIQAGAISNNKLNQILSEADLDKVKQLATPRLATVMTAPTLARARNMASAGYTQAEIAEALGIPVSTLSDGLRREE